MSRGSLLLVLLAAGCAGASIDARGMSFEEYQRYQQIRPFVQEGGDLDKPAADGFTPLTDALRRGYPRLARYLIAQGASVRQPDATGISPIHLAVGRGDLETTTFLLAKGADANTVAAVVTPLALAVARQDMLMIVLLLEHRANPDLAPVLSIETYGHVGKQPWIFKERDRQWTLDLVQLGWPEDCLNPPLATAVANNLLEIADLLLRSGAKTVFVQKWARGPAPLLTAVVSGNLDMLRLLLKHGADPRGTMDHVSWRGNSTALHVAAAHGNLEIVKTLVDAGAPISPVNDEGETPMTVARLGSLGPRDVFEKKAVTSSDPPEPDAAHRAVIDFLRSRGAK